MGQIHLNDMEFYAYHGCYHEEKVVGNRFVVNLAMDVDMERASRSDRLEDALNYAQVYDLVKQEMAVASNLLEHLCARIVRQLFDHFRQLNWVEVKVEKLNPPIDGQIRSVSVTQQRTNDLCE